MNTGEEKKYHRKTNEKLMDPKPKLLIPCRNSERYKKMFVYSLYLSSTRKLSYLYYRIGDKETQIIIIHKD
jgi:hypothetical protein